MSDYYLIQVGLISFVPIMMKKQYKDFIHQ